MFIAFACLILAIIALVTLRDWIHFGRKSSKSIQKSLKRISQLVTLKKWDLALKELAPLIENNQGGKEAALFEIQILRGKEQMEKALSKIQEAKARYSDELLFRLEEGLVWAHLEEHRKALIAFQASFPILNKESDLIVYARSLLGSGHAHGCLEVLHPFLEHTTNGQLVALAADAYYELKDFHKAIHFYNQALLLKYASHVIFNQLGHAYRRSGNLADAENIFCSLLDKNSFDLEAILGMGACLQERGHYTRAFLMYQEALVWNRDSRLLNKAAYTALCTQRYSQAERYFSEIMKSQEFEPDIMAYYGLSLESQDKWQEAEQNYLKLIERFPSSHHGYRALAWLFGVGLSQTISNVQGLNFAHRALKLQNDPISWEILSACVARTGDFERAYQIQLSLAKQDKDHDARSRRQQALRMLRKGTPLQDLHVIRSCVA